MADVIWQTEEYRNLIKRRVISTDSFSPRVGVIDMYGNSPDSSLLFRGNGRDTSLLFGGQTLTASFYKQYQTVFDVKFVTTIGGTVYTLTGSSLQKVNYEASSVAGNSFCFGDFIAKSSEMTFFDTAGDYDNVSFDGAEGVLSYGVKRTNGAYYWVSCGSFLVEDSSRAGITIWLSLVDYKDKFNGVHTGAIAASRTIFGIAQDACTSAGIVMGSSIGDVPNGSMVVTNSATLLTSSPITTDAQLITYVAQATGTFAVIGRDNKLYFRWYSAVSPIYAIDKSYIFVGQKIADYEITVTGVGWTDIDGTQYTNGTNTYQLNVLNNPLAVANYVTLLTGIATNVVGFSYSPIDMKWAGDPALDVGDIIIVPDKKGNMFSVPITSLSLKNILSQSLKSAGESHVSNSAARVSATTQIESAKNEAIAYAKFMEIVADRITTGTLDASLLTVINMAAQTLTNDPTDPECWVKIGEETVDGLARSGIYLYNSAISATVPAARIIVKDDGTFYIMDKNGKIRFAATATSTQILDAAGVLRFSADAGSAQILDVAGRGRFYADATTTRITDAAGQDRFYSSATTTRIADAAGKIVFSALAGEAIMRPSGPADNAIGVNNTAPYFILNGVFHPISYT